MSRYSPHEDMIRTADFDVYTDDDVIALKARYEIDPKDPAVGIMRDGAMVETVVYPDGTEVHVADLDDATLEAAQVAADEAVRNGDHIDTEY